MSRIGKMPIELPAGVEVKISNDNVVTVKGAKGTLTQAFDQQIKIEMDGNVIHIPDVLSGEESYIEKVGGETFEYTKDETGKWVKSKSEDDPTLDLLNEDDLMELIDSNNYYLVEGTKNVYRQKDDVRFEKFKDVTITLEEDSCKIDMIAYVEVSIFGEMALTTHIVISNIGEMNVKLPSVA